MNFTALRTDRFNNLQQDYMAQLKKQAVFINNSCDLYDKGFHDEAIRIASALRIIFLKSRTNKSIIEKLPVATMFSTAGGAPPGASFFPNLTALKITKYVGDPEFIPKIHVTDDSGKLVTPKGRFISLNEWWEKEPVYVLANNEVYVRKSLAKMVADKDGGTHVDENIPANYEKLISGAGCSITLNPETEKRTVPFKNAHLSALRQIGFEVLHSPEIRNLLS